MVGLKKCAKTRCKNEKVTRASVEQARERQIHRRVACRAIVTNGLKWIGDVVEGSTTLDIAIRLPQRRSRCCHHLGLISQLQTQRYQGRLSNSTIVYFEKPAGGKTKKPGRQSHAAVATNRNLGGVYVAQSVVVD